MRRDDEVNGGGFKCGKEMTNFYFLDFHYGLVANSFPG